ncbi:ribosomal RNA large subunit methyltransferase I [Desulfovibrio ferrophilus]|uniref:Ribosomal RNA large subunit methyltransferase I n=1 Tax=Desulfovibrio ferrophilus TaxID=241368 RepID=A0A2Z6B1U5_9BACT|nr:ribosomal RNA large subunit methyltransferase I [Desulfovibrio ferrophilus]
MLRRHPWIFSGAVQKVEGSPKIGETVDVVSASGGWLASAAYSPESQIQARVWTFDRKTTADSEFFRARIGDCIAARRTQGLDIPEGACRLIGAESDGLPGVVVDRYGDWLSGQFMSAGAERHKGDIAAAMLELTGCKGFWDRSDSDIRAKEGLVPHSGLLLGDEPPEFVEIDERPARFLVDIRNGHKTGYYLDQRDNRRAVGAHCQGQDVLNCFSYTGGFGVTALLGGAASCLNLDVSAPALDLARRNVELNGLSGENVEYRVADVFAALREYRDENRTFDVIVLDPPKFVESRNQLQQACRGYKDINLSALRLLRPGGLLFTFSCSGLISDDLFQKVVAGAALDAGRDARIVRRFTQAPDHPVALNFPEGSYLKGLLVQVM